MLEYELKKLNLSEKREQQLKLPYIAKDVETIRIMTEIYCHAHHNTKEGLCPECEEFYLYSVKRLACCPFGEKKPVCAKCNIHCYGKGYKEIHDLFRVPGILRESNIILDMLVGGNMPDDAFYYEK